ncbi:hypothetical protein Geu3261_0111_035 [Komagataeibacter europaeus NBRC 3261]|uniref:Uncharacterized protein n=1 Tax=Komagataeibacter europaeus NBRC 3261 TaxID=1234669 RepID=A0A0D6PZU8_KOMEU|nr:hypothetical protein [Komagataeibacter europaeus]GAN96837.1 hypothetical protein Geu3261_0111_035 [Komagataeibacter europaeus NBRC 3261]
MKTENPKPSPAVETIPDISFELLNQARDGMVIIDAEISQKGCTSG